VPKNQNTFEKRRRELDKKQKAEEKRARRQRKKDRPDTLSERYSAPPRDDESESE
jgi:hypothetical protein